MPPVLVIERIEDCYLEGGARPAYAEEALPTGPRESDGQEPGCHCTGGLNSPVVSAIRSPYAIVRGLIRLSAGLRTSILVLEAGWDASGSGACEIEGELWGIAPNAWD